MRNCGALVALSAYLPTFSPYYPRGDKMDKAHQEQQNRRKSEDLFNCVTNKVKPENQNQPHNSRREGMGPNSKRKPS